MARLSFALPILDRCERPRTASVRAWRLQPGRLAQGPDEKCGMTGRTPGGLLMALSFQIEAPRWGGVARRPRQGIAEPASSRLKLREAVLELNAGADQPRIHVDLDIVHRHES